MKEEQAGLIVAAIYLKTGSVQGTVNITALCYGAATSVQEEETKSSDTTTYTSLGGGQ